MALWWDVLQVVSTLRFDQNISHIQLQLDAGRISMKNGGTNFGSSQEFLDFHKDAANTNEIIKAPFVYIPVP